MFCYFVLFYIIKQYKIGDHTTLYRTNMVSGQG